MAGEMREIAETAIGRAIIEEDCKQFQALLTAEHDVQFTDRKGNTYLHFIATMYKPYIFHQLVASQININAQNKNGNTALHVTALQEECCHVTDLMASGIDPFIRNKDGKTAAELATHSRYWRELYNKFHPGLRQAITDHNLDRVRYLLNCWCSVEAVIYGKDMRQHAAALTYHDIVAIIDQYRFSVMAAYGVLECNYDKLRYALSRNECDPNFLQKVSGAHAHHMLQHAVKQNKRRLVAMLIDAGADVNTRVQLAEYMLGPLYFSVLRSDPDFDQRITEKVLSAHPDVNAKDEKGRSAVSYILDRTTGETTLTLVQKLIDAGTDIALRDNTGCTARDIAMFYRRHDVRDALDKHLISVVKSSNVPRIRELAMDGYRDIFTEYKYRDTFIYAAGNETEEMTDFLLTLEKYWEDGDTVHQLCENGNLVEVEKLIETQTDKEMLLHYKDKGGRTPLMKAIMYDHYTLAECIISQSNDCLFQRDNLYRNPLHYAVARGQHEAPYFSTLITIEEIKSAEDVFGNSPFSAEISEGSWLAKELKAKYGLDSPRVCMEQYEKLLRVIRSNSLTMDDFNAVLKGLKCPISKLPTLFKNDKFELVPRYRDLLLAALDHGKDDIVKRLVNLGADCNIIEKYYNKETGESRLQNAEQRASHLGRQDLVDFIRRKQELRTRNPSRK